MLRFRHIFLTLLIVIALLVISRPAAQAISPYDPVPIEALPDGAVIETVLSQPRFMVAMDFTPDGRLLYTERSGNVSMLIGNTPVVNPVITFSTDNQGERGLLGIAVDPNFSSNHYVWAYYTNPSGTSGYCGGLTNRVVRFTLGADNLGGNPQIAGCFPVDEFVTIHNGGNLHFGPDGKLYVTVGNNNSTNDSSDPAQVLSSPLGKIHRYNPTVPLTIPSDDPFYNTSGAVKSIYAYGLRNSFDFAFDSLPPHQLFATENGDACDDEINRIVSGGNYGWHVNYGIAPNCDDEIGAHPELNPIPPLIYWTPTLAPTGITFYTGDLFPDWQNDIFMCNYKSATAALHHFKLDIARTHIISHTILSDTLNHQAIRCRTDIQTGPDGAIYYSQDGGFDIGPLMRISRTLPFATTSADVQPAHVQSGDFVTYTLNMNHAGTITNTFSLTATLSPSATLQVGSIQYQHGTLTHDAHHIWWTGNVLAIESWTATFQVQVTAAITTPFFVTSSIDFTAPSIAPLHFAPVVIVNGYSIFLPIILRNG